ncbi:unnamed protein product [Ambrosiozyma monospora]|uniref:Unnamed protein product n=1 Tax=Ambrosiozyma monospora TaxID=43982 RepID=A0ACB5TUL2_AMBMO|nr:unnamed protein product [Ambrosiozyma monospora]
MATKHFSYPAEYDSNINVGLPMYAISGNHDDATGDDLLSPLDLLSVSGLLNHYGRVTNNDNIVIHPLLFNKGTTNLALYGLQSIREERLKKTMFQGNLEFLRPDTDDSIQWFNLMSIHQNHVPRPGVRIIEEAHLPDFLDFVLWGHEHECHTTTEENVATGFHVLQPGSSIATSLSEGEVPDKHVFVLSVKGKDFALEPIRLKSVRPFAMKTIVLSETGISAGTGNKDEVLRLLHKEVEDLISEAEESWKTSNARALEDGLYTDADVPLPLVRLRVEYSGGYEVENPRFFSNRFVGKVANVNDVVLFYRKKATANKLAIDLHRKSKFVNGENDGDENEFEHEAPDEKKDIVAMINEDLDDSELILLGVANEFEY